MNCNPRKNTKRTRYSMKVTIQMQDEQGRLVYDSNIRIMNDFTVWFMKKVGFEWNEMDRKCGRRYL